MPQFSPFAGLRYAPSIVLDQVIAPPYDVIESAERTRLAARHRANAVLIEVPEADLHDHLDRYQVAARLVAKWRSDGTLVADPTPSLYPYRMTTAEGLTTTGVLGLLGVGDADVLPHEETLPKPKSDRLDLLVATDMNTSPIWGLSMTKGLSATFIPETPPLASAFDDDGTHHELWVLDEPDVIAAICDGVAASPVVIADGHHRLETARTYQAEQHALLGGRPGPYDYTLCFIVELTEDQLHVGAVHRTITDVYPGTDVPAAFAPFFDVVRAGDLSERTVNALAASNMLTLLTPEGAWLLSPRAEAYEAATSDLDPALVAVGLKLLGKHETHHCHTWRQAFDEVVDATAAAAVLLRPVTVAQITEWAQARRRMPPKTTYFTPKPRTGMVFRTLVD